MRAQCPSGPPAAQSSIPLILSPSSQPHIRLSQSLKALTPADSYATTFTTSHLRTHPPGPIRCSDCCRLRFIVRRVGNDQHSLWFVCDVCCCLGSVVCACIAFRVFLCCTIVRLSLCAFALLASRVHVTFSPLLRQSTPCISLVLTLILPFLCYLHVTCGLAFTCAWILLWRCGAGGPLLVSDRHLCFNNGVGSIPVLQRNRAAFVMRSAWFGLDPD